jgi:hypothetical protein
MTLQHSVDQFLISAFNIVAVTSDFSEDNLPDLAAESCPLQDLLSGA